MKTNGQIEMTSGPLGGKILKYALLLAATGILQQLFNAADIAVVGQYCGTNAQAAVGANGPVIGLMVNFFVGISLGSNVVMARLIGKKDAQGVSRAVHSSVLVALTGGFLLLALGETFAGKIVRALSVPNEISGAAEKYLRIYFLGMPVILLYNFEAAIFRSTGDTRKPLAALTISGVVNVALNLFFVRALGMDVDGVATATAVSNLVSATILFIALLRTNSQIKITVKRLKFDAKILSEILRIGVPAGVQSMIFSFANIIIQSAMNTLGAVVIAGSASAFNLEILSYYVINSFGQACSTFVGQNFGAGKNERCLSTLKICLAQCAAAMAISCSLILIFSRTLLAIFNRDSGVIEIGIIRLKFLFTGYVFSFAQEVLSGYLRGWGASLVPALCAMAGICGVRLAWIFTVFKQSRTFITIMTVYPISLAITALAILLATLILRPSKRYSIKEIR